MQDHIIFSNKANQEFVISFNLATIKRTLNIIENIFKNINQNQ
jgi:hypothetical protein